MSIHARGEEGWNEAIVEEDFFLTPFAGHKTYLGVSMLSVLL